MGKPSKPCDGIPLTTQASGQWCKKFKRKIQFFVVSAHWKAALNKYLDGRDDLQAGRQPRRVSESVTVGNSVKWTCAESSTCRTGDYLDEILFGFDVTAHEWDVVKEWMT